MKSLKPLLKYLLAFLLVLCLWQLACSLEIWSRYILPTPSKVWQTFLSLLSSGKLFKHLWTSLRRIGTGFSISILLGIPLGVVLGLNATIYSYLKPILEFLRHTPPLALVPMLILWFGIGETSKIIIIVLASIFPILLNTLYGIRDCDPKLIEVGKSFKLSSWAIFIKIIWPAALPLIINGLTLALGYSWRAIIGAEMIAASAGVGYMILDGQQLSRPDVVIVGIFIIGSVGILTDSLLKKLTHSLIKWKGSTYAQ